MRPTMNLRWTEVDGQKRGRPPAIHATLIHSFPRTGEVVTYYQLQQLWKSDIQGEPDEWRPVEIDP